jgi:RNA polymerase sigma-70 factor (ECF subfamily)
MAVTMMNEVEPQTEDVARASVARDSGELELLAKAKAGHAAAWAELFNRYKGRILTVAARITRNHEDGEDVVQQSFQSAFLHLDSFQGESRFSTWLTRIAINEALMVMRRRRPNIGPLEDVTKSQGDSYSPAELQDSRSTPEQQYAELEFRTSVMDSVLQLRPSLRAVVLLRDMRDFSTEETANLLGISVAAVKARMFQARNKLRERLHGQGLHGIHEFRNRRNLASAAY